MIGDFAYLVRSEARNRLRRQAQRLRRPRYLLALLVGVGYFWVVLGGPGIGRDEGGTRAFQFIFRDLGPLMLGAYVTATWLLGRRDALAYRPAEVHLLFPAPLTRRDLLRYKLLQAQVPLLFTATFLTLATHGGALPWWLRFPSLYVLFATLQLHHTAAALVHAGAEQLGRAGWRRNWLPITLFTAALLVVLSALAERLGALGAGSDPRAVLAALHGILSDPGPRLVLAPFRLVLAPVLAASSLEWLRAFGIALAVLAAHYVWVLRSDVAFEEAAAEAGDRRARALRALQSGQLGGYSRALSRRPRRTGPAAFRLHARGRPEVGIIWKNLTFARRDALRLLPLAVLIAGVSAFSVLRAGGSAGETFTRLGVFVLGLVLVAVVIGPVWVRNDLRMDLPRLELIRTLPLPASRVVGAEIAASALTLAAVQLAMLLLAAALFALGESLPIPPRDFMLAFLAALLLLPAFAALGVTLQCALALAFPAWVQLGAQRAAGVEAMGQNIITLFGSAVLLALALVPVALAAGAGALLAGLAAPPLVPAAAAAGALLALGGELALAVRALGHLYARLEPGDLALTR